LLVPLPASLGACGILTGLDQITESDCVPTCGSEGGDEATATSVDASAEAEASVDVRYDRWT